MRVQGHRDQQRIGPRKVVLFHEGRGSQEGIFRRTQGALPDGLRAGQDAAILAHNLTRELQMCIDPRERHSISLPAGQMMLAAR